MNRISRDKFRVAVRSARKGVSVRRIAAEAGIARETAHRIQKAWRAVAKDLEALSR